MTSPARLVVVLALVLLAARSDAGGTPHTVTAHRMTAGDQAYAWSVMVPAGVEPGGPAILFLHGYGECRTDGERNLAVGFPAAVQRNPERWPFVIIVPQKPIHNTEWEDHQTAVLAMLDEAAADGLYDPGRLAITGLSQGGHGTITIAGAHPDRFRAAAPVCGYVERRMDANRQRIRHALPTAITPGVVAAADGLRSVPTWLFHGVKDSVIPVEESRALHAALVELDADPTYTELPDADHNAWDDAYTNPDLAAWFIEHTD